MNNMAKVIGAFIGLIMILNISACFVNEHIDKNEIREISNNFMELFVQENTDELFNCFCSDIRENRKEETIEEIQNAFDFIDGDITEYKLYSFGSEEEHKSDGKITYFQCNPRYDIVFADKEYRVVFHYCHAYKDHSDYEGIWKITVVDNDNYDNKVNIGQNYPSE